MSTFDHQLWIDVYGALCCYLLICCAITTDLSTEIHCLDSVSTLETRLLIWGPLTDWLYLPEVALEGVIKVCWLTLSLTAADLTRPLHTGPVDGSLTEEHAQALRTSLQPPRCQVQWDRQGLARKDRRQHHGLCRYTDTMFIVTFVLSLKMQYKQIKINRHITQNKIK